jgi:hypothetical protein
MVVESVAPSSTTMISAGTSWSWTEVTAASSVPPSLKQGMTTATEPGMPGDCRGLRRQLAPFTTFVPKLLQADAFGCRQGQM